ncbi:hypothetical protein CPB83DRAFT_949095 [Crepidotus variabilis]|uniref:Uncharacterized protein n=1 Tax=Crepidotus variabilis TaxID=179855 RepID=A0A9P6JKI4_9AGAR|nr:hypothetical protein CPB83DRAFT_949095 [Crepidotus variabilis]
MPNTTVGGTDNKGLPALVADATAITYDMCVQECGHHAEPASWTTFSQQFSAWLLPYLALISQLPFGANDKLSNLQSMLLTVGSPVLAAYSLILTTLNGRWIARRFLPYRRHPLASRAVRALSRLQQAPLRITDDHDLLSALIHHEKNQQWWDELLSWLNLTHSWSISAATSIVWVFIAFIFTVIDSLSTNIDESVWANGQAVGSVWLWLLAVVVGWLQISPKCDSVHLDHSLERANKLAFTSSGKSIAETDTEPAIYLDMDPSTLRYDESRSPPIFNYARSAALVQAVERVADAFDVCLPFFHYLHRTPQAHAKDSSSTGETIEFLDREPQENPGVKKKIADPFIIRPRARRMPQRWGDGTWERIFISSCIALFLQWSTTGAAFMVLWYTPTKGMGCRSFAYLCYGILSTLVWAVMLLSSILSHYAVTTDPQRAFSVRIAKGASIMLRRLGKCVASVNAIGLVVICVLQFGNVFDRCYCNSSKLTLGDKAYMVIQFRQDDIDDMTQAWAGGVVLSGITTIVFYLLVNLFVEPSFPSPDSRNN